MHGKMNPYIARFIRDNCIVGPSEEAEHKEFYQAYLDWLRLKRMWHAPGAQSFYHQCKKFGLKPIVGIRPVTGKRCVVKWEGARLKAHPSSRQD